MSCQGEGFQPNQLTTNKEKAMSIILCERCGDAIDSDEDAECFVEAPFGNDLVHCQGCRDATLEKAEREAAKDTV